MPSPDFAKPIFNRMKPLSFPSLVGRLSRVLDKLLTNYQSGGDMLPGWMNMSIFSSPSAGTTSASRHGWFGPTGSPRKAGFMSPRGQSRLLASNRHLDSHIHRAHSRLVSGCCHFTRLG